MNWPKNRRGLTALFWPDVNPYGAFRLDTDKHLELLAMTHHAVRW